ncbi:MAG: hypothetical protein JXR83_04405 [Deltaproteobacteria bacterium]|nr:hypothetical protein [Deltaproteobacteria bacterium]
MSALLRWSIAAAALAASCAGDRAVRPPAASAATPSRPELPRSSLAALLERRTELELSDAQVAKIRAVDEQLEQANAALRSSLEQQLASRGGDRPGGARKPDRGGDGLRQCVQCRSARPGQHDDGAVDPRYLERLDQLLDENDRKAFAGIEPLLDDGQRAIARAIAARYREQRAAGRAQDPLREE